MKNVMIGSLRLFVLCMFCIYSSYAAENGSSEFLTPPIKPVSSVLWQTSLVTFEKHLKTDPVAARAELQNVSATLFNGHLLTEEWVPLYFRIRHKGTEHYTDLIRLTELEIRMLTDIAMETEDFQKYSPFINRLQKAYQEYEEAAGKARQGVGGHSHDPPAETGNVSEGTGSPSESDTNDSDIETLRVKALERFKAEFNDHPDTEKMVDITIALGKKKEVTYPEMIELTALQIQIMKDVDPEKFKTEIRNIELSLRQLESVRDLLQKQGSLETTTLTFTFDIQEHLSRLQK